jgi:hypothetical protein
MSGIAAIVLLGQGYASAHNGIEHIAGKVSARSDTTLTIETVDHTTVKVLLDKGTTFTWNERKASLKDLSVGDRVAVNAKETPDEKLHGLSVKWKK